MMKKAIQILGMVLIIVMLSSNMVFAGTSKKTIPNTNVKVEAQVVDAFVELGFEIKYNKNLGYAGLFSVGQHSIIMKSKKKNHILHEMGHFVARLRNAADETSEFVKIYKSEKKKYNGAQKKYIRSNSKEYFAQSFMEYTNNPSKLRKSRPKTYNFIKNEVKAICQEDINNMYAAYSWAW